MYGPTETTVWSSCWRVASDAVPAIDLGRPVLNTSIQVLDEHLQPCPIGVPGEIYIGGSGVALGYHRREALTAERFVEQPGAQDRDGTRLYRTGDLGRWRHDGSLEHGGRVDDQIKLRGFRVELGEIETRLLSCPGVARAVVALREDSAEPSQARGLRGARWAHAVSRRAARAPASMVARSHGARPFCPADQLARAAQRQNEPPCIAGATERPNGFEHLTCGASKRQRNSHPGDLASRLAKRPDRHTRQLLRSWGDIRFWP